MKRRYYFPDIALHEGKNSDKVVAWITDLRQHVSNKTYNKYINAYQSGLFSGLYLTKTGKVRASIIK